MTKKPEETPGVTPEASETPEAPEVTKGPEETPGVTPETSETPEAPEVTKEPEETPGITPEATDEKENSKAMDAKTYLRWAKGKLVLSWGKVKNAAGYDIFVTEGRKKMTSKNLVKTVKEKKASLKLKKIAKKSIKKKKNYTVKIKAYKMVKGKKVYLGKTKVYYIAGVKNKTYTNAKKVKILKKSLVLKKGKTKKIKATIVKQDKSKKLLSYAPHLRYTSSDTKVVTVTGKGRIKAKGKGSCYVYVTASNGVRNKVKITVK